MTVHSEGIGDLVYLQRLIAAIPIDTTDGKKADGTVPPLTYGRVSTPDIARQQITVLQRDVIPKLRRGRIADYANWMADLFVAVGPKSASHIRAIQNITPQFLVATRNVSVSNHGITATHLLILAPEGRAVTLDKDASAIVLGYNKGVPRIQYPTYVVEAERAIHEVTLTPGLHKWLLANRPDVHEHLQAIRDANPAFDSIVIHAVRRKIELAHAM